MENRIQNENSLIDELWNFISTKVLKYIWGKINQQIGFEIPLPSQPPHGYNKITN